MRAAAKVPSRIPWAQPVSAVPPLPTTACIGMVAVAIVNRSIDMELITLIMQVISVEIAFDDKKHLLAEMTTVAYFVIWVMRIAARNAIMFALYEHMFP